MRIPHIKKVIFNDPATIVIWKDDTKTVVKCGENDIYDPEKGLAMAIAKKALGNKGNYFNEIKKWTEPWYEENTAVPEIPEIKTTISEAMERLRKSFAGVSFSVEKPVVERRCATCKYHGKPFHEQPCRECYIMVDYPEWEPKDSCQ